MKPKKRKIPNADQLIAAINRRDIELLQKHLTDGADANSVLEFTSGNITLLAYAAGCQFLEGVELLLKFEADPDKAGTPGVTGEGGGQTALHEAINGADIKVSGDDAQKRLKIIDLLLKAGANPNAVRDKDTVPLCDAARSGYFEICQRLIDAGAWVKELPSGFFPPLFAVVYNCFDAEGRERIVNLFLLEHGAVADAETAFGATPLMAAASRCRENLVNLFLERGADANRQARNDGRTPLLCVAHYFRYDAFDEERQQRALRIAKRLLDAGADPTVRNKKGECTFDIASRGKSSLLADYLKNISHQVRAKRD